MQFSKITRDILFFLYTIYFAQDSLYAGGSIISQASLLMILLISGVYFVKTSLWNDKNNLFFNAWTLLLLLNIIGFIFTIDFSNSKPIDMFKNILGCLLLFYPFYYFARKDELKATHLIRFFLVMLPIIILRYFTLRNEILQEGFDENNVVNNLAYMFVGLLPYIFLIKHKKLISASLIVLILIFVIQGSKRGAIIAGSIGLFMYFYYQMKTIERHNRIFGYLFAIIIMFVLSAFAYKTFMSNEFLINRMTYMLEGDTSNRDILYSTIFNEWYNTFNIGNFIFGFGFAGSLVIVGDYAHNDWLELLSSFGLIGICVYLFFFYAAIKQSLNYKWKIDKRILMLTLTMICFFVTLVSMWYTDIRSGTQAILFGYLIGSKSTSLE